MKKKLNFAAALCFLAFTATSYAVFPYESFSWSGSGTVNPNIEASNSGTVTPGNSAATNAANPNGPGLSAGGGVQGNSVSFVTGLRTGTMTGQTVNLARLQEQGGQRNVGFNIDFEIIGGGTADLILSNTAPPDGGAQRFNAMKLQNFTGTVTGIRFRLTYNEFIAARTGNGIGFKPMLSGVNTAGSSSTFDLDVSLKDVFSKSADGNFTAGTSSTAWVSNVFNTPTAGQTDFVAPASPNNGWKLIRNYDGEDVDNDDEVYAKGIEINVTVPTGTFANGDVVQFSLDGQQYSNLSSVPEPTTALLSLSGLALLLRRKRA